MEYAAQIRKFPDHFQTISMRVTVMDNHGQIQFTGKFQLPPENLLLKFPRRIRFPIIIQTNFPDSYDFFMLTEYPQFFQIGVSCPGAVLRMNPNGGIDKRILFRKSDCGTG